MSEDHARTGAHQMTGTEFTRDTDYVVDPDHPGRS